MSNYYGYVSVDALMEFAHNHVNGMIDSNDIARFPKANVKDANEQHSLQEIFGIPFARLRELAEAEREKRVKILPFKPDTRFAQDESDEFDIVFSGRIAFIATCNEDTEFYTEDDYAEFTRWQAPRALAATEPKGDAT